MAKKTKDSNLSLEERLEQALIPNWDEPYKLPPNWCWVKLDSVSEILNGYAFKSSLYTENGIRIIRITNVQDGFIEDEKPVFYPFNLKSEIEQYILKNDDLLMSLTGNVGRVALMKEEFLPAALNQRVACLRMKSSTISTKYLFYCFLQKQFIDDCTKSAKGSAQLNMSTEWLKGYSIPLPPTHEQLRIVERIESLFAKLDEAKEKAQEVVDGFETRKAAILHKAFSGELTAKWREKNDVPNEAWQQVKLGHLLKDIKYGTSEKSDYSFTGVPILRIPNIGEMELLFDDVKQLQREECSPKEYLAENDILIIRSNGSKDLVGKCALVCDLDRKYTYASFLIRLKTKENVLAEYIVWYLNSEDARRHLFRKAKSSAGIHNINSKEIADIDIRIPSIKEQAEVVRILSNLTAREKQARYVADETIEQIDTMKKSILAHAFRGELGTNNPSEESAVELLKQII